MLGYGGMLNDAPVVAPDDQHLEPLEIQGRWSRVAEALPEVEDQWEQE